jgi:hypothetical protein
LAQSRVVLKLGGKPLDLSPKHPVFDKLRTFLDKAPADEVFTKDQLTIFCSMGTAAFDRARPILAEYTTLCAGVRYWGNPAAIAELRRQVGA